MARKMEGHMGAMAGWRKWVGGGGGWSDQLSGGGDALRPRPAVVFSIYMLQPCRPTRASITRPRRFFLPLL